MYSTRKFRGENHLVNSPHAQRRKRIHFSYRSVTLYDLGSKATMIVVLEHTVLIGLFLHF